MNIFYATDENYCAHTGVSIASLLENNKTQKNIVIYIVEYRVSAESHEKLASIEGQYPNAGFVFLSGEKIVEKMQREGVLLPEYRGNITAAFILLVSELLPDTEKRVLCLDCDTLVVGDLSDLMETNMEHSVLAAVKDWGYGMWQDSAVIETCYLKNFDFYFNSGVILFNLDLLRQMKLTEQFQNMMKQEALTYPDQDILNMVVPPEYVKQLSAAYNFWSGYPKWVFYFLTKRNLGYSIEKFKEECRNVKIIHFLGHVGYKKAWDKETKGKAKRLYLKYRSLTPWRSDLLVSRNTNFENKGPVYYALVYLADCLAIILDGIPRKLFFKATDSLRVFILKRKISNMMSFPNCIEATKQFLIIAAGQQGLKFESFSTYSISRRIFMYLSLPVVILRHWKVILGIFSPKKLYVDHIEVVITTHCSLHCKHCANLIQYYPHPYHIDKETIIKEVCQFANIADHVGQIRILGGEPLLHPDLAEILQSICAIRNVTRVEVVTNGTVLPKGEALTNIFQHPKLNLFISDYGKNSCHKAQLLDYCRKHKIKHMTPGPDLLWDDYGTIECRNRSDRELREQFAACRTRCYSLLKGKLFICPHSSNGEDLGLFRCRPDEFVDIESDKPLMEKKKELYRYLYHGPEFLSACNYCDNGMPGGMKQVIPGEQLKD